ncbi:uncharacterized protein LOC114289202 [Camellia sinensis]|uniref:uncharacterized protein LOC114289202 n=1 Tax=Camellia sinensis TaxID=4442 RepID=UPI0010355610|nr:uncharacterized protein LOC114289202 [Camellia sinensis]
MEDERDYGPKPFRFLNAWSLHTKFLDVVKQMWEASNVSGGAGFIIATRLRYLKLELKKWNNEVFGNVSFSLKKAEVELHELDLLAEFRDLTEAKIVRRKEVKKEVQNRNLLNSITIEGVLHEDPTTVKQEVFKHFKGLFTENWRNRPKLKGQFKSISHDQVAGNLEASFSEDEVWVAIKSCDGNKSPGPDGFNLICFQKCWEILKSDVLQFFKEFYENGKLVAGVNNSFISLIPKIECLTSLSDFRPISLIGSLYKIVAKVLSHRIKKVMPRVVGEIVAKVLSHRIKKVMPRVVGELGVFVIYDGKVWVQARWRGWVKECSASARVSMLVNGSPTTEFILEKCLRQGDLLSLFLFNLVAQGLNMLMEKARFLGLVRGAVVGKDEVEVSHLQFTDDTIIFCEANMEEVMLHVSMAKVIERIQANFLWGRSELKRKVHLVSWLEATKSKENGGLGIRRIKKVNVCFLAKWLWRFGAESNTLWKRILCSKYGSMGGNCLPIMTLTSNYSKIWTRIISRGQSNPQLLSVFLDNNQVVVGNGSRIHFWTDYWMGPCCVKNEFPRLFSLSTENEVSLRLVV